MIEETKRKYYVNFKPETEVPPSNRDRGHGNCVHVSMDTRPTAQGGPLTQYRPLKVYRKFVQNHLK
jgi:hypothetical protein